MVDSGPDKIFAINTYETYSRNARIRMFKLLFLFHAFEGDDEYCIIIEDDLEMSPFWYTWLKKAWLKYGDREDISGIALQVII